MESNWGTQSQPSESHLTRTMAPSSLASHEDDASPLTLIPDGSPVVANYQGAANGKGKRNSSALHGEQGPAPCSAGDLSRLLLSSRLFEVGQLEAWMLDRAHAPFADSAALAEALVRENLLTAYQAEMLANGHVRGLVLGRYEVLLPLGEGGMGMVFRARHRRMRRDVALKVLPRELVNSDEAVRRFHREVQAAAKLHHPNIAAAYDADEDDGVHFLVMELVEGPDLANYVAEAGELPPPVAVQLTIQAARGLAHAHLQGVVHRDVKPANLVVNVQGTLKILDMGLAQLRALGADDGLELTQMGQAMGTIDYMAPEQAVDAASVDHRADIYSLGCTMFYLLSTRPISPDGSIVQKLLWHQAAPRPSLLDFCPDATERLDAIFQRMVAPDPNDRYDLMRDVVEDLERVLPELRLGDAELPLIGSDLALYIGLDAPAPQSSMRVGGDAALAPLHATLAPRKSSLPPEPGAPWAGPLEQQLAAAAIMIGKDISAETVDGRVIRGVVNRLSVESLPGNPSARSVRLHVGSADFALHEIREVFSGNG